MSAPGIGGDAALLRMVSERMPPDAARIGVAVSGGGDSMALLHLAAEIARSRGQPIEAVTVDHGLRPDAAREAASVARRCTALDVPHAVRVWAAPAEGGNLQARARAARYALLADWAARRGAACVLLGHTADDQAETFLMRLGRRAGVDGLARMAERFARDGALFARPLLGATRAELRACLRRRGARWCEDPSNDDPRFERVRARRALAALAGLGLDAAALAEVSGHMAAARDALERAALAAAREVVVQEEGDLLVDLAGLRDLPEEIARRLCQGAVQWIGGGAYPPRARPLAGAIRSLLEGRAATLGGCLLHREGRARARFMREFDAVRGTVARPGEIWDGRWIVAAGAGPQARIRALGPEGIAQLPDGAAKLRPRAALLADPGVWDGARLVAAPRIGFGADCAARLTAQRARFADFLASH